jgi:CBS domain containing-hemolysin-like protein
MLASVPAGGEVYWAWAILGLAAVPALVALNGFFVVAEFALVAVRKTRVEEMVGQGVSGAKAVQAAVAHLDHVIAATQLGITLASIALGWIGEPALAGLLQPPLDWLLPDEWVWLASHTAAVVVAFFLITFLHVVLGELVPKTMALQAPDRSALWIARPLYIFTRLTRPVVLLMNGTGNALVRLLGFTPATAVESVHSVEELRLLVEDSSESGILSKKQAELVQKVFRLSGKRVKDCLVPRERMATLELRMPPEQVLAKVRLGAHTRMPVFDGKVDNIVGIVNTKDLFYLFSLKGVVILDDAMYPALFLSPDSDVADALELFRRSRRHMALVRENHGRILGLITMEDVLEEIVGEIEDEHDRRIPGVVPKNTPPSEQKRPATQSTEKLTRGGDKLGISWEIR